MSESLDAVRWQSSVAERDCRPGNKMLQSEADGLPP